MNNNKKLIYALAVLTVFSIFPLQYVQAAGAPTNPVWDQKHFRFRNDDGTETTATWKAAEDTNITGQAKSVNFRVRIETAETAKQTAGLNVTPLIEYKPASGATCGDTTGWTTITTSTANVFALSLSSQFADKDPTTNQLSSSQAGANFIAGQMLESSNPATAVSGMSKSWTEHEWSLQATTNAANGTAYLLRLSNGTNNTNYNTYTVCPQLTTNSAPNAPTQNSPANSATGVSVTPTFLMTATDPDSDKLSYKVTIYSNSACTTVVQTNDQAVSSTGWTGTNATCTASPTACYTSGTQGSFLTQTALSNSTQYWWKASAKDPDGSGIFTSSATCNTFTTAAAATLTFIVSTNTFPTLTSGSPVFATTTLSVNTDNSTGWNVTLSRDTAAATMADTGHTVNITDQTDWIPGAATTTAGNAVRISSFINGQKVLAFRVMTASGTPAFISTAWWGMADAYTDSATTLWAGIASSTAANLKIGNSSVSSGGSPNLNTVLYYLDVPPTQPSGAYSGVITYTATMNP